MTSKILTAAGLCAVLAMSFSAAPASAMTQAELNAECTRLWGPPDHHYTPNGCVKGKMPKADKTKQVRIAVPLSQKPGTLPRTAGPTAIDNKTK